MTTVRSVRLRLIYDSRGRPTVEATVDAGPGAIGVAGAPSGASTGTHEVPALPSGGVEAALRSAPRIDAALRGMSIDDQAGVDGALRRLDGTPNFSSIGGNTATAVSVATALARSASSGTPLAELVRRPGVAPGTFPAIVGNCLNGGRHAIGGPEIQEFHAFSPEARPDDSVRVALAVHRQVGRLLEAARPGEALGRGDEGGWVAPIDNERALEILARACELAAQETGLKVRPGLDLAASEFYRDGRYHYRDRSLDAEGQLDYVEELQTRFGLAYLEDPFDQEQFDSFARLTERVGSKCLVVGDDLYTTDPARLRIGLRQKATNAILVKVNQIGTITDAIGTVDLARSNGIATVTSHRSGDLPEGWLSHLAVGFGSAGLKCGLLGGERVAKLNELRRLGARTEQP